MPPEAPGYDPPARRVCQAEQVLNVMRPYRLPRRRSCFGTFSASRCKGCLCANWPGNCASPNVARAPRATFARRAEAEALGATLRGRPEPTKRLVRPAGQRLPSALAGRRNLHQHSCAGANCGLVVLHHLPQRLVKGGAAGRAFDAMAYLTTAEVLVHRESKAGDRLVRDHQEGLGECDA